MQRTWIRWQEWKFVFAARAWLALEAFSVRRDLLDQDARSAIRIPGQLITLATTVPVYFKKICVIIGIVDGGSLTAGLHAPVCAMRI
ncbi:hypothetical protein [Collimonas sp.]|uniref:hypothetical protein n=1 Tax=Collimonas sp. TaxID=1963772 RepID=UPI002BABE09F|nr:hypothetical protein [Collimonas sp.]HWW03990.1 hypothetical protein [Collimonas sp.]